nr:LOW QUALITY PROTEIN: pyridoxine/pyridoxamine 5'-phosphate oxidase-like [Nerophis lumbriciformis]
MTTAAARCAVATCTPDPLAQLGTWLEQAIEAAVAEPTAMVLATADAAHRPSARVVLLKGLDQEGLVFYTNYKSRKADDLTANPQAALVFFWQPLARQVRVCGEVHKVDRRQTTEYFASRPRGSRIGAWSSPQSRPIDRRQQLEERVAETERRFGAEPIEPPPFWGGYRLVPTEMEFWQGRTSRLHDRFRYLAKGAEAG